MKILTAIRQALKTAAITPGEAKECKAALEALHASVHAKVDRLETPEQAFARIRRQARFDAGLPH